MQLTSNSRNSRSPSPSKVMPAGWSWIISYACWIFERLRHFQFVDRWEVNGSLSDVAAAMENPDLIPGWWSCFRGVHIERHGGPGHCDDRFVARIRGIMPDVLQLEFELTEVQFPRHFQTSVSGDLVGRGSGTLTQCGNHVQIDFELDVKIARRSIRVLYALAYPLGFLQHGWVMAQGQCGLRQRLTSQEPVGTSCTSEIASRR